MKVNIALLKRHIEKYVREYYTNKSKARPLPADMQWVRDMISNFVQYNVISIELQHPIVMVSDTTPCISEKGYAIEKRLGPSKMLLKGEAAKVAKISYVSFWAYRRKNELRQQVNQELAIYKKAHQQGFGPKMHELFLCYNKTTNALYKVVISDYVHGISLEEWLHTRPSNHEKKVVHHMVKDKIDKMHSAGIIHGHLVASNIILKMERNRVKEVMLTDFGVAFDEKKRTFVDNDNDVLDVFVDMPARYNVNEVVDYVAARLIANKHIIIT